MNAIPSRRNPTGMAVPERSSPARSAARPLQALAAAVLVAFSAPAASAPPTDGLPALVTVPVAAAAGLQATGYDGVVEAVRQTQVAAQVPGAVIEVPVKAGDRVRAGQLLLRLDARAAEQQAGAAAAQVQAVRAAQEAAAKEFERQKQLFRESYISAAALDRAEAQFKATQAQAAAQLAAAGAARTASGFYTVRAPYDGIVSAVAVVLGDMAMPGRLLLTMHDPAALRVSAALPETAAPVAGAALQVELPGLGPARIAPPHWQVLPAVDPATHTVELRLDLPAGTPAAPGMFARAWLPARVAAGAAPALSVPAGAVVRRAELAGVYVVGADGRPLLRQVRLGPATGGAVEVLAGLRAGERVALDPQAAARVR